MAQPKHASARAAALDTFDGTVVAAHGRHYIVAPDDGSALLQCFPRGKKSDVAVNDRVNVVRQSADQGVIDTVLPRRNLLYRSDQYKSKLFAANLDQIAIVVATEPHFSEDLLGRALVAADAHGLGACIILNKVDVADAVAHARGRLTPYAALGYPVFELSAGADPKGAHATLAPQLAGRTTLLLGQSGMGKSTLINVLVPGAEAATREISAALHAGKHTTTFTRRYALPPMIGDAAQDATDKQANEGAGALLDSPGFQEFGLYHLTEGTLERAFPDFRPFLGECRFYNCRHLHEPGCGILEALGDGRIAANRHALYAQLVHETNQVVR